MRVSLTISLLVAASLTGCSGSSSAETGQEPSVVASFYPLAMFAEEVAGGSVDVTNLTPPGVEPHDLELSPDELARVQSADVVLLMGGGFQPAVEQAAQGNTQGHVLDILAMAEDRDPGAINDDPHLWLSPRRLKHIVVPLAETLVSLDPSQAADLRDNVSRIAQSNGALDREFTDGLATCERRTIVTSHDAFGYLADDYDLEQISIAGSSPDAEPDPAHLADLTQQVEDEGLTTIFAEHPGETGIAQTLATETGTKVAVLHTIESLTPEQEVAGEDYYSLMLENLATLREALGCT